jgi:hypothetical protein
VFVSVCVAAVAARKCRRHALRSSCSRGRTNLPQAPRLAHLGARNRRNTAAAGACRELAVPLLSAAERASRRPGIARAPAPVSIPSGALASPNLACLWPLGSRLPPRLLPQALDAVPDRPLPQALEPKRPRTARDRGSLLHESATLEQFAPNVQAPECHAVLPNPSLERTSTGKALGPRGGQAYHPLRGPSALPVVSAQLKR